MRQSTAVAALSAVRRLLLLAGATELVRAAEPRLVEAEAAAAAVGHRRRLAVDVQPVAGALAAWIRARLVHLLARSVGLHDRRDQLWGLVERRVQVEPQVCPLESLRCGKRADLCATAEQGRVSVTPAVRESGPCSDSSAAYGHPQ